MKPQLFFTLLAGILVALTVFSGCDKEPTPDPVCECTDKEHLEPCNCGITGCDCIVLECDCEEKAHLGIGEDCKDCKNPNNCSCVLKVYGKFGSIPIYREGNVLPANMGNTVEVLESLWVDGLGPVQKLSFTSKITEIRVRPTNGMNKNGTILTIGFNEDIFDLFDYLLKIADGDIGNAGVSVTG